MSLSTTIEQAPARKPNSRLRRSNNWKPGQSGNPLGKAVIAYRSAEHDTRRDELAAAIASDFPNPTPFELALIRTAADLLERSENRAANHTSLRMANSAVRIIGKIRDARAARPAPAPKPLSSYGKVQP